MLTANDIERFLRPLKFKMQAIIGRAVLLDVDDSEKVQRLKIQLNGDELIEKIERVQEYGLETNPPIDDTSEVVINTIGGARELAFITKVQARDLRPAKLPTGEVCLYSKFGQTITLKTDGSVAIKPASSKKVLLDADTVELSNGTLRALIDERIVDKLNNFINMEYSLHTHTGNLGAPTSAPLVPGTALVLADFSTTKTKAG